MNEGFEDKGAFWVKVKNLDQKRKQKLRGSVHIIAVFGNIIFEFLF